MICNPAEISNYLLAGQTLLGLDVGSKTIGLALSDTTHLVASPLTTIRRTKFAADMAELNSHITRHNVGALVLGLPVSMDGQEGPRCQSVRAFAQNILQKKEIPLCFWDERLSTAAVTRVLLEADSSRKKRAEVVDKMAASFILQGLLDFLRHAPL